MKFKTLKRNECKILRPEIEAALKEPMAKRGCTVETGNATYNGNEVTFKVTVRLEGFDPDKQALADYGYRYGISEADYGKEIRWAGDTFTLSGISPRSHKYPILADRGGETFKLPAEAVEPLKEG